MGEPRHRLAWHYYPVWDCYGCNKRKLTHKAVHLDQDTAFDRECKGKLLRLRSCNYSFFHVLVSCAVFYAAIREWARTSDEWKRAAVRLFLFLNHWTGKRLFTSFQIYNLRWSFCSNERTTCTNGLGFTVMQFYVVPLVTGPVKITSGHLCSSSSSVLTWDNVLCSLGQVAAATLLSYPQNVSITGKKQAGIFSPSSFLECVCNWLYLWIWI